MKQLKLSSFVVAVMAMVFFASAVFAGDPVHGVDVKLGVKGRTVATETTGQNGKVTFTGLDPAETYTITVDQDQLAKLMKAKEKGNRTKCTSNMRVVGKSSKDYATDPYVETTMRASDKGEITLQLSAECEK